MAPSGNGAKIIRTWISPTAPTGEGSYYEDEHGRVWKTVLPTKPRGTGDQRAQIRNGRIYE